MRLMIHLPDLVDCVGDYRNNVAETSKRVPEIRRRFLKKIINYVQRFEARVNILNPRNWDWEI